jgi:multisubunit Na+/H+ antiporter MnhF subunit
MQGVFLVFSLIQLSLLLLGLVLLSQRRSRVDQIMASQMLATLCVGLFLTMGEAVDRTELYDAGVVLTLLAVITTLAFVRMGWRRKDAPPS